MTIDLVIPGGQSSPLAITNPGPQQGSTTGFSWTPDVRAGTNIILVAGDARGVGTGGSVSLIVGFNANQDSSCLSGSSPSSTAGTPAGAVQTGAAGGGGGSNSGGGGGGGGSSAGAIAGGIVGGITALLVMLALLVFLRRRRRARHPVVHGVDLLPEGAQRDPDAPPEFYQPEPFIVPHASTTEVGAVAPPSMSDLGAPGRPYSTVSTTDPSESAYGAPGSTSYLQSSSRKSPMGMPQMRAVNFVQHEDAGEVPEQGTSAQPTETIELPPSYMSVRPPKET